MKKDSIRRGRAATSTINKKINSKTTVGGRGVPGPREERRGRGHKKRNEKHACNNSRLSVLLMSRCLRFGWQRLSLLSSMRPSLVWCSVFGVRRGLSSRASKHPLHLVVVAIVASYFPSSASTGSTEQPRIPHSTPPALPTHGIHTFPTHPLPRPRLFSRYWTAAYHAPPTRVSAMPAAFGGVIVRLNKETERRIVRTCFMFAADKIR